MILDQDLRVIFASRSFYEFFKSTPEETVGQHIYDLGNKQWDIPKLRELLETILPGKTSFDNYEVEHDFATIGRRTMLLNARQIEQAMGMERIILLAIEDVTDFNSIRDAILVADLNRTIIDCNPAFEEFFGYSREEILGKQTFAVYENEKEYEEMGRAIKDHIGDPGFLFPVNSTFAIE